MSLGECYFCGDPLTSEAMDEVVMVKSGMRPDYAHRECVPKILRPQKDSATERTSQLKRTRKLEDLVEALWGAYALRCQEPLPMDELLDAEDRMFSLMREVGFNPVRMEWLEPGKGNLWLPASPGVDVVIAPLPTEGDNDVGV